MQIQVFTMFTIISKYIHLMLEVSCLLVAFNLAALSASAVANELTDVPQAWYSLDGSHVAFFQKDGDVWYAQISKCDGGEVLWGTDTDRPLCGCVSSDGKSIAVLTGVPDRPGSRYSELRITVITDEEVQFTRDLPGITVVESSGTQTDAVLALAEIDFRRDQPVVTLVSDGRVLRRVKVGEKSRGESVALPLTVYSADSTRTAIANATHFTWKLASLTQRPEISMSHVVAPLSTGMLATCILNARNFKDRKDAWKRLTAKLQIPSSSNYEADDWLFGMKATGCFGWQAVGDVVAPEISDLNVRHKKFVLTESPSRFWLRVI